MTDPLVHHVPVAGGDLAVFDWPAATVDAPVAVAAHGITGNHRSFTVLADHLAGSVRLIAPDLRGRGASGGLPAPYGMTVHADDLVATLDHLGIARATVVGHSMGGFVALTLADRAPERVAKVVLIDGGPSLGLPPDLDVDTVLNAVIGPAMARLSMTFESEGAYLDFWRNHPALAETWRSHVEDYLRYDLVGAAPTLGSSVSIDAVRGDATTQLTGDPIPLAVTPPTTMLRAANGMMGEPGGLYPIDAVTPLCEAAGVDLVTVEGVNHYTIVWERAGLDAISAAITR